MGRPASSGLNSFLARRLWYPHTHTHTDTHMPHTSPPCPPLSFLRFWLFLGLSLRLFRLFLRRVSLPLSRAKYSFFILLLLSFSLALLALLFLCVFLLFLRLFRYLFRPSTRAPPSGTVCVSTPVSKGSTLQFPLFTQGGREDLQGSAQRSSLQDPRKRKLITSVHLLVLSQAVTPLFQVLIHGPSCFHPQNLGFAAELRRSFTTAELCKHEKQPFYNFLDLSPCGSLTFLPPGN